jgi:hypothetical protein
MHVIRARTKYVRSLLKSKYSYEEPAGPILRFALNRSIEIETVRAALSFTEISADMSITRHVRWSKTEVTEMMTCATYQLALWMVSSQVRVLNSLWLHKVIPSYLEFRTDDTHARHTHEHDIRKTQAHVDQNKRQATRTSQQLCSKRPTAVL